MHFAPSRLFALASACALVGGCRQVAPDNPFDPGAALERQARGRIVGRLQAPGASFAPGSPRLVLRLLDSTGREVAGPGGQRWEVLLANDPPVPELGREAAGAYALDVAPGDYVLEFDAALNNLGSLVNARLSGLRVAPGATVRADLEALPRPSSPPSGALLGTVTGAPPGANVTVQAMRLSDAGGPQPAYAAVVREEGGGVRSYSVDGLEPGRYRVVARADGCTPAASGPVPLSAERMTMEPLSVLPLGDFFTAGTWSREPNVPVRLAPLVLPAGVVAQVRVGREALEGEDPAPLDSVWDAGWRVAGGELSADLGAELPDGERVVRAQLRLCTGEGCSEGAVASVVTRLPVTLDREAPAALAAFLAGRPAGAADDSATTVAGCARFLSSACPPPAGTDPWTPALELQLLDATGRVRSWAATLDTEEPPSAWDSIEAAGGVALVRGTVPPVAAASGTHALRVWARDAAGNGGVVLEHEIRVDVNPPQLDAATLHVLHDTPGGTFVMVGTGADATPHLEWDAPVPQLGETVVHEVEVAADAAFGRPVLREQLAVPAEGARLRHSLQLSLPDGEYHWRVTARDDAGNARPQTGPSFRIDTTPPRPPVLAPVASPLRPPVRVEWGAVAEAQTYRRVVRGGPGCAAPQELLTAGTFDILENLPDCAWEVAVSALDESGNESAAERVRFETDSTPPDVSAARLRIDGGAPYTRLVSVLAELVLPGARATDRMRVACDGNLQLAPLVAWSPFSSCLLPPGDGAKTLRAQVVDAAGNVSATLEASIELDTRPPALPVLTPPPAASSPVFTVGLPAAFEDDHPGHYEALGGPHGAWTRVADANASSFQVRHEDRTADATLRVRAVDAAGNAGAEAAVVLAYDPDPPTKPVLRAPSDPLFVARGDVTLELAVPATDRHLAGYDLCLRASGTECGESDWRAAPGLSSFTWVVPADGAWTAGVRARDLAGNRSEASFLALVRDTAVPRPPPLAALPVHTLGAHADVFIDYDAAGMNDWSLDANFSHFEVSGGGVGSRGFRRYCTAARADCPGFDASTLLTARHPAWSGPRVAGLRLPLERGVANTFVVRAVDLAGNVSDEVSVSTFERSVLRLTADAAQESQPVLFGDLVAYLRTTLTTREVVLHLPGEDARLGTSDDQQASVFQGERTPTDVSGPVVPPQHPPALGAGLLAFVATEPAAYQRERVCVLGAGDDGRFERPDVARDRVRCPYTPVLEGSIDQTAPVISRASLAFLERASGGDAATIVVDQPASRATSPSFSQPRQVVALPRIEAEGAALVADNLRFSGETLAWLQQLTFPSYDAPRAGHIAVRHAGADGRFNSGEAGAGNDDAGGVLSHLGLAYSGSLSLWAPGTRGRSSCGDLLAWIPAGAAPGRVMGVSAGADGRFAAADAPVALLPALEGKRRVLDIDLHDDLLFVWDSDGSRLVVSGGADRCLATPADNVVVAKSLGSANAADRPLGPTLFAEAGLGAGRLVMVSTQPRTDLVLADLGTDRLAWGADSRAAFDFALDRGTLVTGGGSLVDLARGEWRQVTTQPFAPALSGANLVMGPDSSSLVDGAPALLARPGADGRFGTGDEPAAAVLSSRAVAVGKPRGGTLGMRALDLSGPMAAWAHFVGASPGLVIRHAGADGLFGTPGTDGDCERVLDPKVASSWIVRVANGVVVHDDATTEIAEGGARPLRVLAPDNLASPCTAAWTSAPLLTPEGDALLASAHDFRDGMVSLLRTDFVGQGSVPVTTLALLDFGADGRPGSDDSYFSTPVPSRPLRAPAASGDRVTWIDGRSGSLQVYVFDRADWSERLLTWSENGVDDLALSGDTLVFSSAEVGRLRRPFVVRLAPEPSSPVHW